MKRTSKSDSSDLRTETPVSDRPASTLLHNWGKKMADGHAAVIPVFVGGGWTVQVPRGNKRVLRVNVPNKKKQ